MPYFMTYFPILCLPLLHCRQPSTLDFWDRPPRSHTSDRGRQPSTAAVRTLL